MSQISLRTLHPQFVQLARPLGLQRRPGVQGLLEAALAVVHQGLLMTRHLIAQRGIGLAQAAQRLRVVMQREGDRGDWVLAMSTTGLREVEFHGPFDVAGAPLGEVVRTGLGQPWASRPPQSERYSFRVRLNAPGQYTACLRVVSKTSQPLTLTAFDLPDHMAARHGSPG